MLRRMSLWLLPLSHKEVLRGLCHPSLQEPQPQRHLGRNLVKHRTEYREQELTQFHRTVSLHLSIRTDQTGRHSIQVYHKGRHSTQTCHRGRHSIQTCYKGRHSTQVYHMDRHSTRTALTGRHSIQAGRMGRLPRHNPFRLMVSQQASHPTRGYSVSTTQTHSSQLLAQIFVRQEPNCKSLTATLAIGQCLYSLSRFSSTTRSTATQYD